MPSASPDAPDARQAEPWQLFWAKTDRDGTLGAGPEWTRPLWAHLLDVAHTALLLWETFLPRGLKRTVAAALGLTVEEAGRWLALQIGLHDLGKAIPSFQLALERAPHVEALRRRGFTLTGAPEPRVHHGHASIALLYRTLPDDAKKSKVLRFHEALYAAIGFHHGVLMHRAQWQRLAHSDEGHRKLGGDSWQPHQEKLLREVQQTWTARYGAAAPTREVPATAPWLLALMGLATVADWLGSMAEAFDKDVPGEPTSYLDASREGATRALARAGFNLPAQVRARPFADLFPALAGFGVRPVQQVLACLPLPENTGEATLTLVEAPTGEGKTEGAFVLGARQQTRSGPGGGFYLALPTQATANGLMPRVLAFLEQAHSGPAASFRLAYGRAELHEQARALLADPASLLGVSDDDGEAPRKAQARTLTWFLQSKRALLAPYGLGTVDQALLGVLYARHFFVRLFGLAGKTVVVDEVHAYDVYTGRLVLALLPWLRALGCHVILLSATLPARLRAELFEAWNAKARMPGLPTSEASSYPAVWQVAEGQVRVWAGKQDGLTAAWTQHAHIERGDPDPEQVAGKVLAAIEAGAVVTVVCNTVDRAQKVFREIEGRAGHLLGEDDLVLLHARFVRRERERLEKHVVGYRTEVGDWVPGRFGKGRPSGPAVLVGTQVVEQSLDLDADLLMTDLAPIDLVLQRAGRLHRHARTDRPDAIREPCLVWLCPDFAPGALPDVNALSGGGHVYARTVLWRTAMLLHARASWSLPADYRPLIESVYGADGVPAGLGEAETETWRKWEQKEADASRDSLRDAKGREIPAPGKLYELFAEGRAQLAEEDDEEAARAVRAATREGDSVDVVVLHENAGGALFLDPDNEMPAPLDLPAPRKPLPITSVRALLGASVRLSRHAVIQHLRAQTEFDVPGWAALSEATPSLRNLYPIVLKNGAWRCPGTTVRWHDRLGLVYEPP